MQFRDNDLRAVTPDKPVDASIIHRPEIEKGTGQHYSGVGVESEEITM